MFALLVSWADEQGTARIGKDESVSGRPLGRWAATQRTAYRSGTLRADRAERLGGMPGWSWERFTRAPTSTYWNTRLADLVALSERSGGVSRCTRSDLDDAHLLRWVEALRRSFRQGRLSDEQVAAVEAIEGWRWDVRPGRSATAETSCRVSLCVTVSLRSGLVSRLDRAARIAGVTRSGIVRDALEAYLPSRGDGARRALDRGECPWCDRGPFRSVAMHTRRSHGISAGQLWSWADGEQDVPAGLPRLI